MLWVIGSQPFSVEFAVHEIIALGVGYLEKAVISDRDFNPNGNHPVFIAEPFTILSLSSVFEKQEWTRRKRWMIESLCISRSKSSFGFVFEEAVMFLLMERFGGKFTALGEVFHLGDSSRLGLREVTLVSLMRTDGDVLSCCEVSWSKGSSDRLGFKAQNVEDVLTYLTDPKGKPFLFPRNCMGPDILCFLQDKKTRELILLTLQAKAKPKLDASTWLHALNSVTPEFFYTMNVRLRPFVSYCCFTLCL
jgi:hypothetical protein